MIHVPERIGIIGGSGIYDINKGITLMKGLSLDITHPGGCKWFCVNGHLAGDCQLKGATMTDAKRSKRVKPDPELLKLADALLVNYRNPKT